MVGFLEKMLFGFFFEYTLKSETFKVTQKSPEFETKL